MSQIAQALAKAKERTGQTTAPFMSANGGSVAPFSPERAAATAAAIKKAKNSQRFWLIVAIVMLPITGFIVWTQLRAVAAPEAAPEATPYQATAPSAPVTAPAAPAPAVPAAKPPLPKVGSAAPRPEIQQVVNNLSISAVMPGEPARIMLAGRIVRAGQTIDGGIVFIGIADGQLQFADSAGGAYSRHY